VEEVLSTFEKGTFLDFCHDLALYSRTLHLENDPQVTLGNAATIHSHSLAIDLAIDGARRFRRLKQSPNYTLALEFAAERLRKERNDCFVLMNQKHLVEECIHGQQMELAEEVLNIDCDNFSMESLPSLVGKAYLERDHLDKAQALLARLPQKDYDRDDLEAEIAGYLLSAAQEKKGHAIFKTLIDKKFERDFPELKQILYIYARARRKLNEKEIGDR
jgi:tetratricopeptide (TPR) repeat protein